MQIQVLSTAFAFGAAALLSLALAPVRQAGDKAPGAEMAAMMKQAERYTQPGEQHKVLERFVGRWNTETRVFMGANAMPPEKGTSEFSWLMPRRWLQCQSRGTMFDTAVEQFYLLGYDNFMMSFVATGVTSMDTAMNRFEGDMTPDGKALVAYGTIDEYLTGEHDKMVKYAWRFVDADKIVLEVHDLPIGEVNTKVVEITYVRAK